MHHRFGSKIFTTYWHGPMGYLVLFTYIDSWPSHFPSTVGMTVDCHSHLNDRNGNMI